MARIDLFAIPGYFATMGLEYRYYKRKGDALTQSQAGPTGLGYERRDTQTSLSMGMLSLAVPLFAPKLLAPFVPGKGRYGKHIVGAVGLAIVGTTAADVIARRAEARIASDDPNGYRRARTRVRMARATSKISGPIAIGLGTAAATTAWQHFVRPSALWEKGRKRDLGTGVLAWSAALIGWDLLYYVNHRLWHTTRFMWANHVMHHSSQRYNLSTALRQATTDPLLFPVPYASLCLLGVRPDLVATSRAINLVYQYWIHTEAIRQVGPLEAVANTPSHHRVHHGVNPRYIDRNHGGILIIWDRLFGTFTKEDEPVVYGLTKNIDSFNLLTVNFHEYRDIITDVSRSRTWRDRLSFTFRGPGWAYERHRNDARQTDDTSLVNGSSRQP